MKTVPDLEVQNTTSSQIAKHNVTVEQWQFCIFEMFNDPNTTDNLSYNLDKYVLPRFDVEAVLYREWKNNTVEIVVKSGPS